MVKVPPWWLPWGWRVSAIEVDMTAATDGLTLGIFQNTE
jgi:hypothetical protein